MLSFFTKSITKEKNNECDSPYHSNLYPTGGPVHWCRDSTGHVFNTPEARNSQTVSAPPVAAQDKAPKPLCEILKEYRIRHNMTQEFIAEQLDVSRQAVSKWENGTSDPSTSNLIALAKLYGVSVDEMLKAVQ